MINMCIIRLRRKNKFIVFFGLCDIRFSRAQHKRYRLSSEEIIGESSKRGTMKWFPKDKQHKFPAGLY